MKLPLRFKLSLVCLLGLLILGGGSLVLFSRAWVDLSRAYGLLSINRRLESAKGLGESLENGEWGAEIRTNEQGQSMFSWLKTPEGMDPSKLGEVAIQVSQNIAQTKLAAGSFEMALDPGHPEQVYFVAFGDKSGARAIAATRAHRSLWDLSAWAAPFLGFFVLAVLVTTAIIVYLTGRLSRSYTMLSKAMRDVGAGRLENLELPTEGDESVRGLSAALHDMTSLLATKEQKIAEVSQLADEDAMTGMKNYRAFTNYMKSLFDKYKGKGDSFPVLAIVDLDFFKKVNDNYGHQVGDFVLRETSALIKKSIRLDNMPGRTPDFCGRYGGEEFVVIFSECHARSMHIPAMRLMKEIKTQKLVIPDEINEKGMSKDMTVSASIGIAAFDPTRFKTKEEWIKEADAALYEAKHRGRARLVRIMPELQEWT